MLITCKHAVSMSMIQIRNVPDAVHRQIKARAALAGMSLSEYLNRELGRLIERPTRTELLERLASMPTPCLEPDTVSVLQAARAER